MVEQVLNFDCGYEVRIYPVCEGCEGEGRRQFAGLEFAIPSRPMWLWSAVFLCFFAGLRLLLSDWSVRDLLPGAGRLREELRAVIHLLQEIEETLSAGLVPARERWEALRALSAPWGELAYESLQELRSQGGVLLPTLRRLRGLAQDHDSALGEARARSSQALAQAGICALLVPAFGFALYSLLPALSQRFAMWLVTCAGALLLSGAGALWMISLAEKARWGGLPPYARTWVLASQCAGERFLALVRSGNPADLAWVRSCGMLQKGAPELAERWGASVWREADGDGLVRGFGGGGGALQAMEEAGDSLRRAVQVSLMEGRPCTERVEVALQSLRQNLKSQVERELSLLSTRALKPLFLCVAPALFLLLAVGIALTWSQVTGELNAGF
jgi:hypothetical protein